MSLPKTFVALEKKFKKIVKKNPREAAEAAYALAVHFFGVGDKIKGQSFADKAVELFKKCGTESYEACAAIHNFICGIAIPEIIHEDVVRFRLHNFWISPKKA
jgi:hypothetical protein